MKDYVNYVTRTLEDTVKIAGKFSAHSNMKVGEDYYNGLHHWQIVYQLKNESSRTICMKFNPKNMEFYLPGILEGASNLEVTLHHVAKILVGKV